MKHRELADAKRELVEAVNGYDLALRAASAELSRACKAAADRFGPQIDAARAELALADEVAA
jgi:hypothetical protein